MQLRMEFGTITGLSEIRSLKNEWSAWAEKVINFAKLEAPSRPAIGRLLTELESTDEFTEERGNFN